MRTRISAVLLAMAPAWACAATATTTELVIATVNNGHMITMQQLAPQFEAANPDIRLKWVTLDEGVLRQRVSADIAARGGQFDIMTIGMYEAPIWAQRGWLEPIQPDAAFDIDDLLPAMRSGLSYRGRLYASPFYGESSMTMYREDLLRAAGLTMPNLPTWQQIATLAARLHDPARGVNGICLRGKPGWGDNIALISTMVNAFGGQWFDRSWQPRLTSPAWREAVGFYIDLLRRYGPPGAEAMSFNENLALFQAGRCAIWVDATIAASFVSQASLNPRAAEVAFAQAPSAASSKGARWLWAWALAIPAGSAKTAQAQRFIRWATSKDYVRLVGQRLGWGQVPSGTRVSTYRQAEFLKAARWALSEASAIAQADPRDATVPPSPYTGVQFAAIPEFQAIGEATGAQIAAALAGRRTLDEALAAAQQQAEQEMRRAGYLK